jgi:hypothetical protein
MPRGRQLLTLRRYHAARHLHVHWGHAACRQAAARLQVVAFNSAATLAWTGGMSLWMRIISYMLHSSLTPPA